MVARRINRGLPEYCDGHRGRLKLIRVLWWTHGYAEGHQSAVVATGLLWGPPEFCCGYMWLMNAMMAKLVS